MPPKNGYFHPDREANSERNWAWLSQNGLLRRTTYRDSSAEIYEAVAAANDEEVLRDLEADSSAETSQLEKDGDRLRLIAGALKEHFKTNSGATVCLFVDTYESGLLADAENRWYNEMVPSGMQLEKPASNVV